MQEQTVEQGKKETNGAAAGHGAHAHAHERSHVPTHPRKGTGAKIGVAAAGVAVALGAVFVYGLATRKHAETNLAEEAEAASSTPPAVEVARVTRATAVKVLQLPGEARPFNETTIYARTSGYISKWLVDIGDPVKQGQVLAMIETPELDEQLNAAKAKLGQAQAEAKLAVAAADFAKLTYNRWQAAAPEGVVSEQERDEKKSEQETAEAKVAAANSAVNVAEAEVHRLETLVSFKQVVAPFAGTITQRHIDIGDLVTAGSTTSTTPLFSIAKFDQMRVFVNVPQGAIPEIKNGMTAVAHATEYPGRKFIGTVDRTSEAVDRLSRTMRVEVIVPNQDRVLKPGDYVEVSFQTDRNNPPLQIPASALNFRPEGPEVAVVSPDNKVTFRRIDIAQDEGDHIEVAKGLKDGEMVALNIGSDVSDGSKITPHVEPSSDQAAAAATPAAPAPASEAAAHPTPVRG